MSRYCLLLLLGLPVLLGAETTCIPKGAVTVEPGAVVLTPKVLTDETTIKGAVEQVLNQKGILTVVANAKKEQNASFEKVQKAIVNNGMPAWVWVVGIVGVLVLIYLVVLQFKQLAVMQDQCLYTPPVDERTLHPLPVVKGVGSGTMNRGG